MEEGEIRKQGGAGKVFVGFLIAATAGMGGFLLRDRQETAVPPQADIAAVLPKVSAPEPVPAETVESNGKLTLPGLAAKVRPSVLQLVSRDASGKDLGTGTGFIVGPGLLVTNRHVVRKAVSVEAKSDEGTRHEIEGVIVWHLTNDLALLSIRDYWPTPLELADDRVPETGEDVAVIGSPLGLEGSLSNGIVSAIRPDSGGSTRGLIQITAPISPGSSGSPVVDSRGRVIGVATSTFRFGQNVNFAVPAQYVREMLDEFKAKGSSPVPFREAAQRPILEEELRLGGDPNFARCKTLWEQREWALMLPLAENLDKAFPETGMAKFLVGVALMGVQDYPEAEAALEAAVTIQPDFLDGWVQYGKVLNSMKRQEDALAAFLNAMEIDETHAETWAGISESFLAQGLTQDAQSAAEKAIENQYGNFSARMVLGQIFDAAGAIEQACESYRVAMDMNPSSEMAGFFLTALLCRHGREGEARAIADRLRSTRPQYAAALDEFLRIQLEASAAIASSIEAGSTEAPQPAENKVEESARAISLALDYLRRGDSDSPPGQGASFYSDPVDYFDEGVVSLAKAIQLEKSYESRWPTRRHFPLQEPFVDEVEPGRFEVRVTSVFAISDNKRQFKQLRVTTGFLIALRPKMEILSVKTLNSESKSLTRWQFKGLTEQIGRDRRSSSP